jgi:hypothetical protein
MDMPTRVLDVNLQDGTDDVALRDRGIDPNGRYIALSHCWGADTPLKTTRSNIDAHKTRINWASLPPLFQDAIFVT